MSEKITLYELGEAYKDLEAMAEDNEALIPYLEAAKGTLQSKANNIIGFIRNLELTSEAIENEIERLKKLKDSYRNKSANLRNYIAFSMQKNDIERVDTDIARLSFRKSKSVIIDNLEKIPIEYTKTKVEADKTKIKKAIEEGEYIEGARIEENNNLQIK